MATLTGDERRAGGVEQAPVDCVDERVDADVRAHVAALETLSQAQP
jgi:hypothetical protein